MEKTLPFQDLPKNFDDFLNLLRCLANDIDVNTVRFVLFFDFHQKYVQIDYDIPKLKDLIVFRSKNYVLLYDKNNDEFFIPESFENKTDYFRFLQQLYEITVFKDGKYADILNHLCQILFNCNLNVIQKVLWNDMACCIHIFDNIHKMWLLTKKEPTKIEMLYNIINDLQKRCKR